MWLTIENTLGFQKRRVELPEALQTVQMQELLKALIPRLGWPVLGPNNEPNRYRVYHNSREIPDNQTLQGMGVQENDTLRIMLETPAGGYDIL